MITYNHTKQGISVLLDKKKVGTIKFVRKGYEYFPKGSKNGGGVYDCLTHLKQELEKE